MSHVLSEHDEARLYDLIPKGSFFFLAICTSDGSRVYCNMPASKVQDFLKETAEELKMVEWKT